MLRLLEMHWGMHYVCVCMCICIYTYVYIHVCIYIYNICAYLYIWAGDAPDTLLGFQASVLK